MNQTLAHPAEKSAQLIWTAFILMFFMIQAVIWTFAISITSRDTSHAVVSGYDEQALNWDEVKEARAASALLGWQAELLVDRVADIRGVREFTIQLFDADKSPLGGVDLRVRAFHRAAASQPQELAFVEMAPGVYSSKLDVDRHGKWCFSGTAIQEDQQFLFEQILVVTPASKGQ